MSVPTVDSLQSIYTNASLIKQGERYDTVIKQFNQIYGRFPEFIVRSPGRVNLIGEHIDYSGYGVLPMAIERDVVQAVATDASNTKVQIANMNPKYPTRTFEYEGEEKVVTIDSSSLEWSNYFKCGYKGMLESSKEKVTPKGMSILVDGTVPAGSGLSSSAAFVCSSALAVITANQLGLSKQELTEVAIVAERNVGVNSGGMDQAASVFAEKNYALYVEFVPKLKTLPVQLPSGASFVIAHTLVTADKFTSGPKHYNLRVVETKMGARILAHCLFGNKLDVVLDTYKQVMDEYFKTKQGISEQDQLTQMLTLVDRYLTNTTGYTVKEMADAAGMVENDVVATYMTRFPVQTDVFRLHQRAVHVLTEARRVQQFIYICHQHEQDVNNTNNNDVLKQLGDIMNSSHESCATSFDCSCPELDQVCNVARQHGAFGARLTGAGWGGAAVFLTTPENVPTLIQAVKEQYYHKNFPEFSKDQLDDAIFPTEPCRGATIFTGFDQS
ncbi:galactokinase [Halteromyces radiatus]|uniref:galactokinase n=1 Tax=Halteromyces radiatus TaxID=101107 RepID=UPI00221F165B|nr:galactokinase [Halteromyces radiatus]KAI8085144.1 galactokinase [Halteromyces radiatus]